MNYNYMKILTFFILASHSFGQIDNLPSSVQRAIRESGVPRSEIEKLINDNKELIQGNNKKNNDNQLNDNLIDQKLDATKVQQKIKEIEKNDKAVNISSVEIVDSDKIVTNEEDNIKNDIADEDDEDNNDLEAADFDTSDGLKYFGYNIFNEDPSIFQLSSNISIDPNYIVGPGDEIILMLWGETEINTAYTVSTEGYLFIDNIGQIFVNGLTMEKLEKKLYKLLRKVYSSLGAPSESNAKTYFDLSLGSLSNRPLRVFVLGEVNQPGAYSVNPSTTLFSSLFYFNGPTTNGSLREIRLIRNGKIIKKIDFYDYILRGTKVNDVKLQRDDIIFIPNRGKTVSVVGEVKKSAIFELKPSENFEDLLKMAGGLNNTAYTKRSQVDRIISPVERAKYNSDRIIIDFNLNDYIVDNDNKADLQLYDGDKVTIFRISDFRSNVITLSGSVFRPGNYQFFEGITILDLIKKADGLKGDAFLQKVDILRQNYDNTISKIVIDLSLALKGDLDNNIKLQPLDEVVIYSLGEMLEVASVKIEGHVFDPGDKPFYEGMTLDDLIFSGGGFKNNNHLKNTYLERADLFRVNDSSLVNSLYSFNLDSLFLNKSKFDLRLKSGDRVVIYSKSNILGDPTESIIIEGNIKRPGEYELTSNLHAKELFFISGGFDDPEFFKTVYKQRFDVVRLGSEDQNIIYSYNLLDVLNDSIKVHLKKNDLIKVYAQNSFDLKKEVLIEGEVLNPGTYSLSSNMSIGDLILIAGGLDNSFVKFRAEVSRIKSFSKSKNILTEIHTFDFQNNKKIYHDKNNPNNKINFILKPSDIVFIRSAPEDSKQEKVTIVGLVYYPGDYIISKTDEKVTDIIERAGGLREAAYARASSLKRNGEVIKLSFEKVIKNPRSKYNFTVLAGDSIRINSAPNLVVIKGEINNPGNYQFLEGNRFSDYIKLAGGMTKDASRFSSFITYPNGATKRLTYFTPTAKVYDGSTITIGRKEEVEPFSITEYVTNITEVYSEFLQLYVLLTLSNNNN